jgi:quercetin dioxygenase-like cupin family protein
VKRILVALAGSVFLIASVVGEIAAADETKALRQSAQTPVNMPAHRGATIQYTRIYTGSDGKTHFEDLEIDLAEVDFAPPAPPVQLSELTPATQWGFFAIPPGWMGDWHPAPRRQVFFYLVGKTEIEVGDGTIRRFGPGDAVIVEDTMGKGHRSRTIGDETALQAVVQMPADE